MLSEADKRTREQPDYRGREGSNVPISPEHTATPEPGGSKERSPLAGPRGLNCQWHAGFSPMTFEEEEEYASVMKSLMK